MTIGGSTSGKSSDFECGPWGWYRGMGNIHMNKGRAGEGRGSKEMDSCPLTLPPLQKDGITMHEDRQEIARSALVKGIESKMAALIYCAAPGYLRWNCAIFGDTPLAPSPCVDRSRPKRSDVYWSSTQNADATTLRTPKVDDISLSILTIVS
jgi:hypothetical protein